MGKKRPRPQNPEQSEPGSSSDLSKSEPEEVYTVEVITKARVAQKKKGKTYWEYYVQWAGYDREDDTWEPEWNVESGSERLCKSFWDNVGMDWNDYGIGHIVEPTKEWIAQQKRYHAEELKKAQEREERKKQKTEERKNAKGKEKVQTNKRKAKRKATSSTAKSSSSAEASPSKRRKRVPSVSLPSESSEDEATPSQKVVPGIPGSYYKSAALKRKEQKLRGISGPVAHDVVRDLFSASPEPPERHIPEALIGVKPFKKKRLQKTSPAGMHPIRPSRITSNPSSSRSKPSVPPTHPPAPSRNVRGPSTSSQSQSSLMARPPLAPPSKSKVISDDAFFSASKMPQSRVKLMSNLGLSSQGNSTKQRIAQEWSVEEDASSPSPVTQSTQKTAMPIKKYGNLPNFKRTKSTEIAPALPPIDAPFPVSSSNSSAQVTQNLLPRLLEPPLNSSLPVFPELEPFFDNVENSVSFASEARAYSPRASLPAGTQHVRPDLPAINTKRPVVESQKPFWTGKLQLEISTQNGDQAETICQVGFFGVRQVSTTTRSRFGDFLSDYTKAIRIPSLHDVANLDDFMLACAPITQMARVAPIDPGLHDVFAGFVRYLQGKRQVCFIPTRENGHTTGHILLFPPALSNLATRFDVPGTLQVDHSLVAALLPFKLSSLQQDDGRLPASLLLPSIVRHSRFVRNATAAERRPRYQLALRILNFPDDTLTHLSSKSNDQTLKAYIWFEGGDGGKMATVDGPAPGQGLQTLLLQSILAQCGVKPAFSNNILDANAVFIHVGAMRTMKSLPSIAALRRDRRDMPFYTYGSHYSIPTAHWGVHTIFPYGGVVTLTVKCLYHVAAFPIVEKLIEHPLWDCYVLPEVLGGTARGDSADPLAAYDSGELRVQWLLDYIDEGKVALMRSPPYQLSPSLLEDPTHSWGMEQVTVSTKSPREILQYALVQYDRIYSGLSGEVRQEQLLDNISGDLDSLQMHPAINRERRRFVVLTSEDEETGANNSSRGGLEWISASNFRFLDEYFDN